MRHVQVPEKAVEPRLPDKTVVKQVQVAIGAGAQAVETPHGTAIMDAEGLFGVVYCGYRVL